MAKAETTAIQPKKPSLFHRLVNMAEEQRTRGQELIDAAEQLDELALEMEEALKATSEDSVKLKELQATLKRLMG